MTDSEEPATGSLPELLRNRGYWRWSAATQAYRLPRIMAPIAFVLAAVQQRHSVALGGILVMVWTLAPAAVAPLAGRVYDRIGVAIWAPRLLVVMAAGLAAIGLGLGSDVAGPLLVVLTGLIAVVGAGLFGATRTLLADRLPARLLPAALSLDSSVVELVVIVAPFVVIASAWLSPVAPLYTMAVLTLCSAVLLRPRRGAAAADESPNAAVDEDGADAVVAKRSTLWRNPRFWFWLSVSAAFGQSLGTMETCALPLASRYHSGNGSAASLIAILAVTSVLAGFGYGAVATKLRIGQVWRSIILMAIMLGVGIGLGFAGSFGPAAAGYVVIGLCTAPLNTVLIYSVGLEVDPKRRTEAFSAVATANAIGFAVPGALLSLVSVPVIYGVSGAFAACAIAVALGYGHHRDSALEPVESRAEAAATSTSSKST